MRKPTSELKFEKKDSSINLPNFIKEDEKLPLLKTFNDMHQEKGACTNKA